MTVNKRKQAKIVWEFAYSKHDEKGLDVLGYEIQKSAFNNPNSEFGWDLINVYPQKVNPDSFNPDKRLYGSEDLNNLQPISFKALEGMKDKLSGDVINAKGQKVHFQIETNFFYRTKDFAQNGIFHIWGEGVDYYWYDGHKYAVYEQNICVIDNLDKLDVNAKFGNELLKKDEFGNWIPKSKCCYLNITGEDDYSDCIDFGSNYDY